MSAAAPRFPDSGGTYRPVPRRSKLYIIYVAQLQTRIDQPTYLKSVGNLKIFDHDDAPR